MISVEHLAKQYGAHHAVQDVSFRCEPGTVTGFLGPNGAGKSTTLRMLCGLARPTSGAATVLGVPFRQLTHPGRQVGVLLDAAAQHVGRTGREALTLAALATGVDPGRVPDLLARVGLDQAAGRRRIRGYSLGMRQRLGLAHALIGDPAVLILDEPANGLDPEGIAWLRGLLRSFADRGGAVLLSSHLLREVQAVADHLVVINRGRVVADGSREDLLAHAGTTARGADPIALLGALSRAGLRAVPMADGSVTVSAGVQRVAEVAAAAGLVLHELRPAAGLEELFLRLTSTSGTPTTGTPQPGGPHAGAPTTSNGASR